MDKLTNNISRVCVMNKIWSSSHSWFITAILSRHVTEVEQGIINMHTSPAFKPPIVSVAIYLAFCETHVLSTIVCLWHFYVYYCIFCTLYYWFWLPVLYILRFLEVNCKYISTNTKAYWKWLHHYNPPQIRR